MIFPLRYGPTGQILSEPWMADDPSYWRTPRTWHTWCRRCRATTTHDTEAAAAAADEAHECRRRDLYETRRARSKAATAAADSAAQPPRGRHWTPDEDDIALTHDIDDAMAILDRSRRSVAARVERLRRDERRLA